VRILSALAAGLSARGDVTALACLSRGDVERAVEAEWPRLSHRAIVGTGFVRRAASLRGIVTALRPDALLVGSDTDASMAAVALGNRGGVVRRLTVTETAAVVGGVADTDGWRQRLARSRTRYDAWGTRELAISWPQPTTSAPRDADAVALDHAGADTGADAPRLLIVPPHAHDEQVALALRAASQLRARVPALRVTLLGDVSAMQSTRLHAAALDLTAAVEIAPLDTLLRHAPPPAFAAWVCAHGDTGAVATLAAMHGRLPVVVPTAAPFAALVTPGTTGYYAQVDTLPVTVSSLARLMGDADAAARMGEAAADRAARTFGWEAFVEEAALRLARVSGASAARVTARPSLTPA
jgi:glycosyltransferase involved in cell wall biosynthesis